MWAVTANNAVPVLCVSVRCVKMPDTTPNRETNETMTTIVRPIDFDHLTLRAGSHQANDNGNWCVMEAVAFVAGEAWSDRPQCTSPTIGAFARSFNDHLDDEERQRLAPFILKMVGTNTGPADEETRRWLVADWMTHVHLPAWLDAAGMTEQAKVVRALPKIDSLETYQASRETVRPIGDEAWTKRRLAMDALRSKVAVAVRARLADRPADAVADAAADAVADAVAAVAVAVAVADAAAVAAVADAVADAGYRWRAVYDAVKPIFVKAINDHPVVGPTSIAMKDSGFALLDALCVIGR